MSNTLCAATLHWLAGAQGTPPAELVAHVAGCARCRGALAATFGALATVPDDSAIDCAACEDALPAYLEFEHEHGLAATAQRYPQIWWHLWFCPECAEQARLVAALLDAEAAGELAGPPRARPRVSQLSLPPLRLARSFLSDLFRPQAALGAAWSSESERTLIAEDDLPGHRIAIYVRQRAAQSCDLEIGIEPPRTGVVVVNFGPEVFRALIGADGTAQIAALPIALFTDQAGPDMVISIEGGNDDGGGELALARSGS